MYARTNSMNKFRRYQSFVHIRTSSKHCCKSNIIFAIAVKYIVYMYMYIHIFICSYNSLWTIWEKVVLSVAYLIYPDIGTFVHISCLTFKYRCHTVQPS